MAKELKSRRAKELGFTIMELLIFIAIFVVVIIAFITILVSITKVQVRQTASAEVNQQSQFLLQKMQYYIERSSLIELPSDTATTTIKLRMGANAEDPTFIYASSGIAYIQQSSTAAQALTSNSVTVSSLTFTKRSNPPAHDLVSVVFTVAYNGGSGQQFSQTLDTSIARVNASAFDSNIIPTTTATYKLGVSGQIWSSVDDLIYFSGSNVGIGVSSPGQTLEVNGGVRLNTVTATSSCIGAIRGTFWVHQSASGTKDNVQVCVYNGSIFLWTDMVTIP